MTRLAIGAVLLATVSGVAPAAGQTVAAANPDNVAQVLRAEGYQAELTKDNDGDPVIRSAASGSKFSILFYGCQANRNCTTLQFYAGFKSDGSVSVGKINEWNRTKRFGRAYIDKESDPCVEMDLDTDAGGLSRPLFADNLAVWAAVVGSFKQFIG